jgi:phage minor structural protein
MFKLLDLDEEYICDLEKVTIAKHDVIINGVDSLKLEFPEEESTQVLKGFRILFKDRLGFWKEHVVDGIEEPHNEEGVTKSLYCESSIYELCGDYLDDVRPYNVTANIALENALSTSRWEVGIVDDLGIKSINFYHVSAKEALNDIIKTWKCEFRTRIEISGNKITHRYIDLLAKLGTDNGKRYENSKDLISMTRKVQEGNIITALYGYGKGEEIEGSTGFGRRISFEDIVWDVAQGNPINKPLGQKWLGLDSKKEVYGRNSENGKVHVFDSINFDNITDAEELIQATYDKYLEVSQEIVTYESKVVDLKDVDNLEHEGVDLGDIASVIDREYTPEIRVKARVIRYVYDLLDSTNDEVTLGNYIDGLSDYNSSNDKFIDNLKSKQSVWDRATIIDKDGTINSQFLKNLVEELNTRMNALGGYVYISDAGEGILTMDEPLTGNPTMAIQLLGGAFRIAGSKLPNGEWNWTTFGDGNGFYADAFVGGILKGGKVSFNLTNGTLLIGNSVDDYALKWDGTKLWINGLGVESIASEQYVNDAISEAPLYTWVKYSDYPDGSSMTDISTGKLYVGHAYNQTSISPSSNKADYSWLLVKGDKGDQGEQGEQGLQGLQGIQGTQGIKGDTGIDGISSYTHIAYSTSATGSTGFSTSNPVGATYIGMYVDNVELDSTNPSAYNWTLIKGADGSQGIQGVKGDDGLTPYLHIAYATNGTGSSGFSTTDSVGKTYIGQYTDFISSDSTNPASYSWTLIKGETGATGAQGLQGIQGVQGTQGTAGASLYTWVKYATTPTTGMSDTPDGKVYIGFAYNKTTATESLTYADYTWSLIKGEDGATGATGANGTTTYTWVKYADNISGGGMSDSPTDKRFLGIAVNKTTATESTTATDYTWSPLYDNVIVGGKNLFLNSTWIKDTTNWGEGVRDTAELFEGDNSLRNVVPTSGSRDMYSNTISVVAGETYTVSYRLKANVNIATMANMQSFFAIWGDGTTIYPILSYYTIVAGVWRYVVHTYTIPSGKTLLRYIWRNTAGSGGDIWIAKPQLEKGNIATEHQQAPEDIQLELDTKIEKEELNVITGNLGTQMSNLESALLQNTTEIKLGVKKEELLSKNVWGLNLIPNLQSAWNITFKEEWPGSRYELTTKLPISIKSGKIYTLFNTIGDGADIETWTELTFKDILGNIIPVQSFHGMSGAQEDAMRFRSTYTGYKLNTNLNLETRPSDYPVTFITPENAVSVSVKIRNNCVFPTGVTEGTDLTLANLDTSQLKLEEGKAKTAWVKPIADVAGTHNLNILVEGSQPVSPTTGMLWIDASTSQLKKWSGSTWVVVGWAVIQDVLSRIGYSETQLDILDNKVSIEISSLKEGQGELKTYFDFTGDNFKIGKSESPLNITIGNSEIDFIDNGVVVAYINGQKMLITSLEVLNSLIVGVHQIEKYNSDITLIKWIGEREGGTSG